ncbi:hypothetical protein TSUD_132290 [Trifolium subterraneum]|uniref:Uncharacterized protein n=1 Tax=Trifolium subterraneum TaxID=3900 RepID=A0A2Z6NW05_TRISU|nr:hypothetical protein TSUD_132290 [Trifolium subterraneum]
MQGKEESHRRRSWLLVQKDDQKGRDNNGLMEMWRHLSMWRPQPKPPDAGSQPLTAIIVVTAEELISGESTSFMSILVENDLEKVRVKWGINDAIKENGSMDKVGISINSMGQTHTNFCRILKGVTIWIGIELLDLVQFNDSNGVLKKGCI